MFALVKFDLSDEYKPRIEVLNVGTEDEIKTLHAEMMQKINARNYSVGYKLVVRKVKNG